MRLKPLSAVLVCSAMLCTRPAFADATAFIGANMTPSNRQTRGFAVGFSILFVGFEGEYANSPDDPAATAPALKTTSGNVLLQTPVDIYGVTPYFTTGGGFYSETLGTHSDSGFALNTGGGVKITLSGPIRVRVDYRVIKLGNGALYTPAHRVYVGLNLKF